MCYCVIVYVDVVDGEMCMVVILVEVGLGIVVDGLLLIDVGVYVGVVVEVVG